MRTDGFVLNGAVSMCCAQEEAKRYLLSCGIEDAAVDVWYLMEFVTGVSRASYLADRERGLSEEQRDAYAALVNRRGAHIPLQHLTGEQEFMGLPFLVNAHVLIPRQDTETLVELALSVLEREIPARRTGAGLLCNDSSHPSCGRSQIPDGCVGGGIGIGSAAEQQEKKLQSYRVLDLCTGSGCIAISLEKQWEARRVGGNLPDGRNSESVGTGMGGRLAGGESASCLELYASDLSEEALAVARENARRLDAGVHLIQSDLFAQISVPGAEGVFDMIVSNPPYIRTSVIEELSEEVRLHEPRMALDGGADGLDFYRKIICESRDHLRPDGWLLMEIGYDQGEAVSDLMRENGFTEVCVRKDLPGNDRVVSGRASLGGDYV
ncbi:MAG: peptide chain release factor N(5)-glutamine methyltransferase [Lachnospiraceae bacterium]|nr:peptide chain release factor N(5)-glutamine methyltransferase [Lachnospiraceae bacterium]